MIQAAFINNERRGFLAAFVGAMLGVLPGFALASRGMSGEGWLASQ